MVIMVALLVLPVVGCAKKPPAPPPPPPAGTLTVEPAKVDFELLKKYFPPIAKALGLPEAMSAQVPHLAMLAVPVKFTGSGWRPKEIITVELVVPPDIEIPGLDRARGEDAVGIAFATADDAGNFEAKMERTAVIGFILRGGFQPTLAPDPKTLIPGNPLPNGTYTLRAVGEDPRSVATTTWVLELKPPAAPPTAAPPTAAPPAAAPGKLPFEPATYTNDQYGFSLKYPKDWQVAPPSKTLITAQKGGLVPAMFVGAVDGADFAEAVTNTLKLADGTDIKVGAVSEATLADGSKGSKAPITATLRGFPAKGLAVGAKKGDKWIVCCVGTVEMLAPYDEALFTAIGTSLEFKK
jgi:hypothetical protein